MTYLVDVFMSFVFFKKKKKEKKTKNQTVFKNLGCLFFDLMLKAE